MDETTYRRYGDLRYGTHFNYKGKKWVKLSKRYRQIEPYIPDISNRLMPKKTLIRFEDAPTCSMGASSTVHGTGAVDTYDPLLQRKRLRSFTSVTRRKKPTA